MSKTMNISTFFEHVLGAPLHCVRWSWGAENAETGEIFLRCWSDEIETINGQKYVQVQWLEGTVAVMGRRERQEHIEAIKAGTPGWLVVCFPRNKHEHPRKIDGFNSGWLFQLGATPIVKDGNLMLPIIGKKPAPRLKVTA